MEDYIFILIAIVLSIFGAMNKKKKMARMQEEEETYDHQPSFFEHVFDDPVFRDEPKPKPKPQPVVVEQPKTVTPPKMKVEKIERPTLRPTTLKKSEIGDAIHRSKITSSPITGESEPEVEKDSMLNDFSLRKAVIYAEILNRKY